MKNIELYLTISAILFVVDMAIIPVGGFCDSNIYHNYYIYSFLGVSINFFIALLILWYKTSHEKC